MCVMSPWLYNIFMDVCMREMKCKVVNTGAVEVKWRSLVCCNICFFADDTVSLIHGRKRGGFAESSK